MFGFSIMKPPFSFTDIKTITIFWYNILVFRTMYSDDSKVQTNYIALSISKQVSFWK